MCASKEKIVSFVWQHVLLFGALFIMTLGVALCVRSNLGSSVISSNPLALTLAGEAGLAPALTIGDYTCIMNFILVFGQILVLRRRFEWVQLCQLIIGYFFGFLLDVNMYLTSVLVCETVVSQVLTQFLGCTVLGMGILLEVRCGSVTMPGEGFPVALSRVVKIPFVKAKIVVDVSLVLIAVALCYVYFGHWLWNVIGPGTLFAMVYVGLVVKMLNPYMGWFDRLMRYRPGFRRYIFGLARFVYRRFN